MGARILIVFSSGPDTLYSRTMPFRPDTSNSHTRQLYHILQIVTEDHFELDMYCHILLTNTHFNMTKQIQYLC